MRFGNILYWIVFVFAIIVPIFWIAYLIVRAATDEEEKQKRLLRGLFQLWVLLAPIIAVLWSAALTAH